MNELSSNKHFWNKGGVVRCFRSIEEVRSASTASGHHWFDPETMQFFGSRVNANWFIPIAGGALFVSSERNDERPRLYTLRRAHTNPWGLIDTVGEFQAYKTSKDALTAMRHEAARLASKVGV